MSELRPEQGNGPSSGVASPSQRIGRGLRMFLADMREAWRDPAIPAANPALCDTPSAVHSHVPSNITFGEIMTTHARNRRVGVPAYYLGRPAAFWRTALAPRPAASHPLTPERSGSAEPSAQRVADRGTS